MTRLWRSPFFRRKTQADCPAVPAQEAGLVSNEEDAMGLRRSLLKQLVSDEHFKHCDGLDVYVEDYSRPELLSREGLRALEHARQWLTEEEGDTAAQDGKDTDAVCAS